MLFCPKCKSIMIPREEKGKKFAVCSCGHRSDAEMTLKEKGKQSEEVAVVDSDIEVLPLTDAKCPKCGNLKAYFWTQQTRSADEPETCFFKCQKCKKMWRSYK